MRGRKGKNVYINVYHSSNAALLLLHFVRCRVAKHPVPFVTKPPLCPLNPSAHISHGAYTLHYFSIILSLSLSLSEGGNESSLFTHCALCRHTDTLPLLDNIIYVYIIYPHTILPPVYWFNIQCGSRLPSARISFFFFFMYRCFILCFVFIPSFGAFFFRLLFNKENDLSHDG